MTNRTVTLPTHDHGEVTLAEPSWCAGHPDTRPQYKADLAHYGPEQLLTFRGETLWTLVLAQSPFHPDPDARRTGLLVEQAGFARTLDPSGLHQLAAVLVGQAAVLRTRARELAALLGGEGR